MIYYTRLTHLSEKQQAHYGCNFIVQVRAKNPCTGYLFPETRKKFDRLISKSFRQILKHNKGLEVI